MEIVKPSNNTVVALSSSGGDLAKDSTLTSGQQVTQIAANQEVTANAQSKLCPTTPSGRLSLTASAQQSSAIGTAGLYSFVATDDCYVAIGSNPTAAVDGSGGTRLLQRGQVLYARLIVTDKVSRVADVAGGYVYYCREGA
jgi:hypothetical protein